MGFFMTGENGVTTAGVKEFVLDTLAELDDIDVTTLAPGSQVIVTGSSKVLILNTQKEWDIL